MPDITAAKSGIHRWVCGVDGLGPGVRGAGVCAGRGMERVRGWGRVGLAALGGCV
ncbi:MAG: hypothetical protein KTU85_02970 [Acidimicrobiia bacterium]|nr:hypothetical protein [Acidimicrobiia bacterium]